MKNLFRKDKPTNKLIALWLVFIMMLVPLVSHMGSKKGAKAAGPDTPIDYVPTITVDISDKVIIEKDFSGIKENGVFDISVTPESYYFDISSGGKGIKLNAPNITFIGECTDTTLNYGVMSYEYIYKLGDETYYQSNTTSDAGVDNIASTSTYSLYVKPVLKTADGNNEINDVCYTKVATYTFTQTDAFTSNTVWVDTNGGAINSANWYKPSEVSAAGAQENFNGNGLHPEYLGVVKYAFAKYEDGKDTYSDYTSMTHNWTKAYEGVSLTNRPSGSYIGFVGYFGSDSDTEPMKVQSIGVVKVDLGNPSFVSYGNYSGGGYLYYCENDWNNFDPADSDTYTEAVGIDKEIIVSEVSKYRYYVKFKDWDDESGISKVYIKQGSNTEDEATKVTINGEDYWYCDAKLLEDSDKIYTWATDVAGNTSKQDNGEELVGLVKEFQPTYELEWTYNGSSYAMGSDEPTSAAQIFVGPNKNLILNMTLSTEKEVGSIVVKAFVNGSERPIKTIDNITSTGSGPYSCNATIDFANEITEDAFEISKITIGIYDTQGNSLKEALATDPIWYDGTKPVITYDPAETWYTSLVDASAVGYTISSGTAAGNESNLDSVVITVAGVDNTTSSIASAETSGTIIYSGDSASSAGTPVSIQATDLAGNTTTENYVVKIDGTAPKDLSVTLSDGSSISVTSPINPDDRILITANDNISIGKVEYEVAKGGFPIPVAADESLDTKNLSIEKSMSDLGITENGEYSLKVIVFDIAGNYTQSEVQIKFDNKVPQLVSSELVIGTTDTTTGITTYTDAQNDTHKISADGSKFYIRGNDTNEYYYQLTLEDNGIIDSTKFEFKNGNNKGFTIDADVDDPNVPQYVFYVKVDKDKLAVDAPLSPTGLIVYDDAGNKTELTIAPDLYLVDEKIGVSATICDANNQVLQLTDELKNKLANGTNEQYKVCVTVKSPDVVDDVVLKNGTDEYLPDDVIKGDFDVVTQRYNYDVYISLPTNKNIKFENWSAQAIVKGNEYSPNEALSTLLYDNTEPVLSGVQSNSVWTNSQNVSYTIVSGEDSSVESNLGKVVVDITNSNADATMSDLADGTKTSVTGTISVPESKTVDGTKVQFKAEDKAGNPFTSSNYTFLVDKTSPEIDSLGIVKDNSFVDTTKPINGTPSVLAGVSDNLTLAEVNISVVYPDGVTREKTFTYDADEALAVGTDGITENFAYTLEKVDGKILDGSYKATVSVKDKATNKATQKEIGFLVDNTLPVVTAKVVSGVTDGKVPLTAFDGSIYDKYYGSNVDVELTYTDANKAGIVVTDNGKVVEPVWSVNQSGQYVATVNVSAEGDHVFEINGTDAAGGQAAPCSVSFNIDKTAPVISSLGVVKDNSFVDTTKPLAGTPAILTGVSDNATLAEVSISVLYPDGVTRGTTQSYKTTEGIAQSSEGIEKTLGYNIEAVNGTVLDGSYVATVSVRDKSTNKAEEKQVWFVIDNTLPVVTAKVISGITASKSPLTAFDGSIYDNYYASDVSVQFTYTDANKDAIVVTDNGTEVTPTWSQNESGQYVATVNVTAEGSHNLVINGTDLAGGQAAPCSVSFYIDKTAPSITTVLNGGIVYTESMGKVKMTADTSLSAAITDAAEDANDLNVQIVKAVPDQPVSAPEYVKTNVRQFTFVEEADYTINLFAIDMAGNQGPTRTVNFRVDKTAPEISISGVSGGGTSSSQATVSFVMKELFWADATGTVTIYRKADDNSSETLYKTINYTPSAYETVISETLTETGEYRIEFTASDWIGHQAETSQTFTIDRDAPELVLTAKQNNAESDDVVKNKQSLDVPVYIGVSVTDAFYLSKKVTMTGTYVNAAGTVSNLTFDGLVQGVNGTAFENIYTEDGTYTINVVTTDAAGNESTASIQFTIDNSDPVISELPAGWSGTISSFEYVDPLTLVSDMTDCEVHMYINGVEYDGSEELPDGAYTLVITAEDELGHTVETSTEFVIDSQAPVFIVTGVEKDQVKNETYQITVSLQLDEDELLYVKLNGEEQAIDPNTKTCTITVDKKGNYTLEMAAKDAAGNESSDTYEFKYGEEFNWWIIVIIALAVILLGFIIFIVAKKKKSE